MKLKERVKDLEKHNDLYFLSLCDVLKGKAKHYRKDGVHLILTGITRANGGIVLDVSSNCLSASYLDDLSNGLQNPNGAEWWVPMRTLLDQMLRDREIALTKEA